MNPEPDPRTKTALNQPEKHPHIPARNILDRIVLGGSDGAIEGLALTSALNGAGLGYGAITLAGLAFALSGALSMFFSSYLSRRSELRSLKIDMARERMEIETEPEEEKMEMRELLKKDGYDEKEVEVILQRLVKDKDLWLREMLRRELQLSVEDVNSDRLLNPLAAGVAFLLLGLLAVSPYAFVIPRFDALVSSVSFSLAALFLLGSRALIPRSFDSTAGLESALIGALAGFLLYLVGVFISTV